MLRQSDSILTRGSNPLLSNLQVRSRQAPPPQPAWRLCLRPFHAQWAANRMFELLVAERRVAECNALIERQRRLIEDLGYEGQDITSAQIVFDSLCISLSLHLQDRHRLRAMLNAKAA